MDYKAYTDKYFLRAKEILEKENLNPIVKYRVFIRKGQCKAYGIDEAIEFIKSHSPNVKISAVEEEYEFDNCDTLMLIEAPIQEIIDLETVYLGIISAETSKVNDNTKIDLKDVEERMKKIVDLVKRPVMYFGARHWKWDEDMAIANACFKGGASACSTDAGGSTFNKYGVGTIPHALEVIYHWKYGLDKAVLESTKAFDKYIDPNVPRIALVDYANCEIRDSLKVAQELGNKLHGVRIDTCGENYMEGVLKIADGIPHLNTNGVCINGVYLVRKLLNSFEYNDVKVILSSGFGNIGKVQSFLNLEEYLGETLFDSLGVGGLYSCRMVTSDIVEVNGEPIHKVGRQYIKEEMDKKLVREI